LATSVDDVAGLGLPPNVDTLKLPGLRKIANGDYSARRLGIPKGQLRLFRSAVLQAAVDAFKPDVLLVDKHPFGAKGELLSAINTAKSNGARLVLGLRDVLDDPATVASEWERERLFERLPEYFNLVLVYGDRSVSNPLMDCPLPPVMADRIHYCGYVVGPAGCASCHDHCLQLSDLERLPRPTVLCTVGGGEDGSFLLKAFFAAANTATWNSVAVGGPLLPDSEARVLRQMATRAGVRFRFYLPCLSRLFSRIDALVCMGGYNTLLEAVSRGVPVVCVPRTAPRSEQLIRARAFAKIDLLTLILPDDLRPERLAAEVTAAVQKPRPHPAQSPAKFLNFDGAQAAGRLLLS
ncbi:MAG TPA: glycosyltransferase, partial [Candidatus Dormibacteraeota bacterium]|nr:glycosyltransferase [Candidatus Dormibacteraeota bacterium]